MRHILRNLFYLILLTGLMTAATAFGQTVGKSGDSGDDYTQDTYLSPNYIIGPGDVLNISAWKNEDLTRTVIVLPDGKISFPLIGEIVAGGKSLERFKTELNEKLIAYVPDPVITVTITSVNSLHIYVIGRVNRPNMFELKSNVNVLQALTMAGGLNPFAKKEKIKIFREKGDKTEILPFNYDEVVNGDKLEQNVRLKRGDVVVVP